MWDYLFIMFIGLSVYRAARFIGLSGYWVVGLLVYWFIGLSGCSVYRFIGLLGYIWVCYGLLVYRFIGLLGCWAIGLLVYRFIGLLGYRFIVSSADWPWGSDIEKKQYRFFQSQLKLKKNNPDFFQYSRLVLLTNLDQYRRPIWNNIFWRYFQYWPWQLPSSISCLKESCRDVERWRQKSSGWSCWHGPATPCYTKSFKGLSTRKALMLFIWVHTMTGKAHKLAVLKDNISMQNISKGLWAAAQVKSQVVSWNKQCKNMRLATTSRTTRMTFGLANVLPRSSQFICLLSHWRRLKGNKQKLEQCFKQATGAQRSSIMELMELKPGVCKERRTSFAKF